MNPIQELLCPKPLPWRGDGWVHRFCGHPEGYSEGAGPVGPAPKVPLMKGGNRGLSFRRHRWKGHFHFKDSGSTVVGRNTGDNPVDRIPVPRYPSDRSGNDRLDHLPSRGETMYLPQGKRPPGTLTKLLYVEFGLAIPGCRLALTHLVSGNQTPPVQTVRSRILQDPSDPEGVCFG